MKSTIKIRKHENTKRKHEKKRKEKKTRKRKNTKRKHETIFFRFPQLFSIPQLYVLTIANINAKLTALFFCSCYMNSVLQVLFALPEFNKRYWCQCMMHQVNFILQLDIIV